MKIGRMINQGKAVVGLFLMILLAIPFYGSPQEQEPLQYSVEVEARLIPVFAVNQRGEPVYDLKEEELELYLDGKFTGISSFRRYTLQTTEERVEYAQKTGTGEPVSRAPQRVVFIIIDTMFTSEAGFERSRQIAAELIRKGAAGDIFIVLGNNPAGGLQLVGSSEPSAGGRQRLIQRVTQLEMAADKWDKNLHRQREWFFEVDYGQFDPRAEARGFKELQNTQKYLEQMRYKTRIVAFSRSLRQFEYALKTIDKTKLAFLISEGPQKGALKMLPLETEDQWAGPGGSGGAEGGGVPGKNYSVLLKGEKTVDKQAVRLDMSMVRYLNDVVKAVNKGGTVLYTINPEKVKHDEDASGEQSLQMLAHQSGGQYFAGTQTEKIIRAVEKTIAAYYEISFPLKHLGRDRVEVKVRCKRKGVKLHSLRYSEQPRPYNQMKPLEKKMFAVNVVSGGAWSRMTAKPRPVLYQKFDKERVKGRESCLIEVLIPEGMANRPVDFFLVQVDESGQKVEVQMDSRKLGGGRTELEVRLEKNRQQFFVVIDPDSGACIFSAEDIQKKLPESMAQFDVFFDRFKVDQDFQRSRVVFPFRQQHFDPTTGDIRNVREVVRRDWQFVDFSATLAFGWSEPEVRGPQANVRLVGSGLDVNLVFQWRESRWFLLRSENRSQGGF